MNCSVLLYGLLAIFPASCQSLQTATESKPLVTYGTIAKPDDYVFRVTVALREHNRPSDPISPVPFCTGTLIANDIVLTAAHCKPAIGQYVMFGHGSQKDPNHFRKIIRVFSHNCFDSSASQREYDLAVIQLEGNAPGGFGPPATLVPEDLEIPNDADVLIAGYGKTEYLTVDGELRIGQQKAIQIPEMSKRFFAVYSPTTNQAACSGDSGGPMFFGDSQPLLAGVTNSTEYDSGPFCEDFSYYIDIRVHRSWVDDVIKSFQDQRHPLPQVGSCSSTYNRSARPLPTNDNRRGPEGPCRLFKSQDPEKIHGFGILGARTSIFSSFFRDWGVYLSIPERYGKVLLCPISGHESVCNLADQIELAAFDVGKGRRCFEFRNPETQKGDYVFEVEAKDEQGQTETVRFTLMERPF